jgi:hypothetical protein
MEPDVTTGLSCTSPDEGSQYVQPGKTPVSNSKLFHRAEERSRDLLSSDGGRLQHATGGEVGVVQAGSGREVRQQAGIGAGGEPEPEPEPEEGTTESEVRWVKPYRNAWCL